MPLRVGVIGAGRFGIEHLRAYAAMPDVTIVSVSDVDQRRADAVAREFGIAAGETPDAVSIVVPAHARGTLVRDAIAAGMAVLIEKPLASTSAEATSLAERASERPVMVGQVLRFAAPYGTFAEEVSRLGDSRHGVMHRVRSADHASMYPSEDVVGLTMIHDLDALPWLAGATPVSVSARGTRGLDGRWVECDAEVVLDDGAHWHLHAAWRGDASEQRDYARAVDSGGLEASLEIGPAAADSVYAAALRAELRHFVDTARAGIPSPILRLRDAASAVALADAIRESLTTGAHRDLT